MIGKYECIQAWANEVGAGWFEVPSDRAVHDDPDLGLGETVTMAFAAWWGTRVYKDYGIGDPADPAVFKAALVAEVHAYLAAWRGVFGDGEWMFQADESSVDFGDLDCTFGEWLAKHEFKVLVPFFLVSLSIQGYGNVDAMPAYLGLVWHHPNMVYSVLWPNPVTMFDDGFQDYWERIAAKTHFTLRLSHEVTSIERTGDAATVAFEDAAGAPGEETFDVLIMAAPMPEALRLLAAPTDEERFLFSSLYYHEFSVVYNALTAGEGVSEVWTDAAPHFVSNAVVSAEQGDWYSHTLKADGTLEDAEVAYDDLDTPYSARKDWALHAETHAAAPPLTMTGLIHPPEATAADLEKAVEDYFAAFGVASSVVHWERWKYYFPRYNNTALLEARKPWRLWKAQGEMNTYHVGSYASFESVADVLDYGLQLFNSKLCAPAPSSAPHAAVPHLSNDDGGDDDEIDIAVAFILGFACASTVLAAVFFYARRTASGSAPPDLEADRTYAASEMT
jgi:hypothetical protein